MTIHIRAVSNVWYCVVHTCAGRECSASVAPTERRQRVKASARVCIGCQTIYLELVANRYQLGCEEGPNRSDLVTWPASQALQSAASSLGELGRLGQAKVGLSVFYAIFTFCGLQES